MYSPAASLFCVTIPFKVGRNSRLINLKSVYVTGAPKVSANNHAIFTIQIQGRLRDYLRLLIGHPVYPEGLKYPSNFKKERSIKKATFFGPDTMVQAKSGSGFD